MEQLPKCFIWDIDGTIAHRTNRSPFDYTKVSDDAVDKNMKEIFDNLTHMNCAEGSTTNHYFIIITGRDESCRKDTEQWLKDNEFYYNNLFMRPAGSKDRDVDIKVRIYREYIEGKYEVIAVFEDSERVVQLWRDHLKLTCLQVAIGKC